MPGALGGALRRLAAPSGASSRAAHREGELVEQGGSPVASTPPARRPTRRPRSGRAASRRPRGRPPTAETAASTVAGSWWSRRVASSMSVRCSRTSVTSTSTSRSARSPSASTMPSGELGPGDGVVVGAAHLADVVEQRRERGAGRAARPAARGRRPRTTVSTRCRSTVWRCTALRCGPAAHGGPLGQPGARRGRPGRALPTP